MPAAIATPSADLRSAPQAEAPLETQLLFGEVFEIENEQDGWVGGKSLVDGYHGYVRADCLHQQSALPTHRVKAAQTIIYASASAKAECKIALGMGALLAIEDEETGFAKIKHGGFIPLQHICHIEEKSDDFVSAAESLRGVPYLWGGRDSVIGIDCSALLQLALAQSGIQAPRNSAEQESQLGRIVAPPLQRGDLVFWQAHIGIMLNEEELIPASS